MKLVPSLAGVIAAFTVTCIAAGQEKVGRPASTAGSDGDLQQKLDVYVGQLKHGSVEERRQAVAALGLIGLRAKPVVPALVERLKAERSGSRRDAAEALCKINKDPAAVAAMVADLKDRDFQVRLSAAKTLGGFGVHAKAAVPALTETLQDENNFVRSSAALALWQIDKHSDAIPALVENVKSSDNRGHIAMAADALGQIGVEAKAAVPVLREALKDKPPDYTVALALWKINKDAAAVPALVEGLRYPESGWRGDCAHALGLIGVEAKAAVPSLIEALKDEKAFVRMNAAEALGALGADAKAAVPALLEAVKEQTKEVIAPPGGPKGYLGLASVRSALHGEPYIEKLFPGSPAVKAGLKDGDLLVGVNDTKIANVKEFRAAMDKLALKPGDQVTIVVEREKGKPTRIAVTAREWPRPDERYVLPEFGRSRVAAAEALWKITKHPGAAPALAETLKDPQARHWATPALERIGVEGQAAVPTLIDALKGEDKVTRVYAATALGQIGAKTEAVAALVETLKDKDAYLRCFAARSLWRIKKDPAVIPVLLECVKDPDNAEALWQINRHPAAAPALVEDLKSGGGGVFELGRIGVEAQAAVAALTDALKDEDEQVRNSAAQSLKKIDPRTAKEASMK